MIEVVTDILYIFLISLTGRKQNPSVSNAIAVLKSEISRVRIIIVFLIIPRLKDC